MKPWLACGPRRGGDTSCLCSSLSGEAQETLGLLCLRGQDADYADCKREDREAGQGAGIQHLHARNCTEHFPAMVTLNPQSGPLEVTGLNKKTPKTEFPQESASVGLGWHTELSQRGSKLVLLPQTLAPQDHGIRS